MSTIFINRQIRDLIEKSKKSIFLLGPRQVGKSTLIESLKVDLSINLADEFEFLTHSSQPDELKKRIEREKPKVVYIDEIQRLPKLLNTIQTIIDRDKSIKFYLTGSSARKLKRGGANLLPGRVLNFNLGPFVASELEYKVDTLKGLEVGFLPEAYLSANKADVSKLLRAYAANYLKEEIKAEALTRNLESFARFLQECVLNVAQFVDYTKLAKKAKISRHAVPRYFEILEDTMIGYRIQPFLEFNDKKKVPVDFVKHPKFFFFDNGVYNGLVGNFVASPDRIGYLSEQLVFSQLLHSAWAKDCPIDISSFRLRSGEEIDFIAKVDQSIFAIEVKTSENTSSDAVETLNWYCRQFPKASGAFLLHMGRKEKKYGQIWSLPWEAGLKKMGL